MTPCSFEAGLAQRVAVAPVAVAAVEERLQTVGARGLAGDTGVEAARVAALGVALLAGRYVAARRVARKGLAELRVAAVFVGTRGAVCRRFALGETSGRLATRCRTIAFARVGAGNAEPARAAAHPKRITDVAAGIVRHAHRADGVFTGVAGHRAVVDAPVVLAGLPGRAGDPTAGRDACGGAVGVVGTRKTDLAVAVIVAFCAGGHERGDGKAQYGKKRKPAGCEAVGHDLAGLRDGTRARRCMAHEIA